MCGIVGWIDWKEDLTHQRRVLEKMTATLTHRGPDAEGIWISNHVALAHRRLIVIDPENGQQPIVYEAGSHRYALTYNGEIYNFRELRFELESLGHGFRTQSDTEVLLHSYLEWGDDCVRRFNGIFAFGLWDSKKHQLLLARDHMGVKPLFYTQCAGSILFASEIKALLAHPAVKAEVGPEGLAEVFTFGPFHTPGFSIYRNIYELRPGHKMICGSTGTKIIQYWSLRSFQHTEDFETTLDHIKDLLGDIVKRQLIADVPVATLLSGGLDSSGLAALAAGEFQQAGKKLSSYSIDFVDSIRYFEATPTHPSLDQPWAEQASKYIGTEHHTLVIDTPKLLETLPASVYAYDTPGWGQIEASLLLLFKKIKKSATVALSGESADEIFGGYPWFYIEPLLNAPTFPWLAMFWGTDGAEKSFSWLSQETLEKSQPLKYISRRYQEAIAEVPRLEGEDSVSSKRRKNFYLNLTRWLPVLLDRKDRMSMATGLEVRVPFCDHRLVEYLWNVPWEMKTIDCIEKGILRRAFSGILPDDIRNRKKSAYPESQNPSYAKGIRAWTLQILNDPNAAVIPFVNVHTLRALAEGKVSSVPDKYITKSLERIIQIETWLKAYHVYIC